MSEMQPEAETLATIMLHDLTLQAWHDWLLTDPDTGEWRDDLVPCSRYGLSASSCAWWAIAAEVAYTGLGGVYDDSPEPGLHYLMGAAVNDSADLAELVASGWDYLPKPLQEQIGILNVVEANQD